MVEILDPLRKILDPPMKHFHSIVLMALVDAEYKFKDIYESIRILTNTKE